MPFSVVYMPLYTAITQYNLCDTCNSTGNHPKTKNTPCPDCCGSHAGIFVCQVQAPDLDVAVGKLLYQLTHTLGYEDNALDSDAPALIDNTVNCWFMILLDRNNKTYLIHIVATVQN